MPGHGPITLNDWCVENGTGGWSCKNPSNPSQRQDISDYVFRRMKAQIYNDATGWDLPENSLRAESEPTDLDKVWGNFTHEELGDWGYDMVITVGIGPHSEDFMATRLSRMAAELKAVGSSQLYDGPRAVLGAKDLAYQWDYQHQGARQEVLGRSARTYLPVYESQMPEDGGEPEITEQPGDLARFAATRVEWVGGSNFSDSPQAIVEKCVSSQRSACDPKEPGDWKTFATGEGEVQVMVTYPQVEDMADFRSGEYQWRWQATFEAFDSDLMLPDAWGLRLSQTPAGIYRFVIEGCHRTDDGASSPAETECGSWDPSGRVIKYHLESDPFEVRDWDGITVDDLRIEPGGRVSFKVGPSYEFAPSTSNGDELYDYSLSNPIDYPDTYSSPFRFIHGRMDSSREEDDDVREYGPGSEDDEVYCFHCSFRPWIDTGAVDTAIVSIERRGKSRKVERFPATFNPVTGRWYSSIALKVGDKAWVAARDVTDYFGEFNGNPSAVVERKTPAP